MMRWMYRVQLKNRVKIERLWKRLEIEGVSDVVRRGQLRWFGNVEHKNVADWVSGCRGLVVDGARDAGRGMKT